MTDIKLKLNRKEIGNFLRTSDKLEDHLKGIADSLVEALNNQIELTDSQAKSDDAYSGEPIKRKAESEKIKRPTRQIQQVSMKHDYADTMFDTYEKAIRKIGGRLSKRKRGKK